MAIERNDENDIRLAKEVKMGSEVAFNNLFNRYRNAVYSICYRFTRNAADAEDLTQEIFVKVYKKINTYDTRAKFFTWLYRVTVNHCISFKRRLHRSLNPPLEVKEEPDFVKQVELRRTIDQAMLQLPKQQRLVFVLRHYNQLSFNEIGDLLKISTGAAKAHHHFAVGRLREVFDKQGM